MYGEKFVKKARDKIDSLRSRASEREGKEAYRKNMEASQSRLRERLGNWQNRNLIAESAFRIIELRSEIESFPPQQGPEYHAGILRVDVDEDEIRIMSAPEDFRDNDPDNPFHREFQVTVESDESVQFAQFVVGQGTREVDFDSAINGNSKPYENEHVVQLNHVMWSLRHYVTNQRAQSGPDNTPPVPPT